MISSFILWKIPVSTCWKYSKRTSFDWTRAAKKTSNIQLQVKWTTKIFHLSSAWPLKSDHIYFWGSTSRPRALKSIDKFEDFSFHFNRFSSLFNRLFKTHLRIQSLLVSREFLANFRTSMVPYFNPCKKSFFEWKLMKGCLGSLNLS